jgi:hypothetical protein
VRVVHHRLPVDLSDPVPRLLGERGGRGDSLCHQPERHNVAQKLKGEREGGGVFVM